MFKDKQRLSHQLYKQLMDAQFTLSVLENCLEEKSKEIIEKDYIISSISSDIKEKTKEFESEVQSKVQLQQELSNKDLALEQKEKQVQEKIQQNERLEKQFSDLLSTFNSHVQRMNQHLDLIMINTEQIPNTNHQHPDPPPPQPDQPQHPNQSQQQPHITNNEDITSK
jgi:SMC interacting uncharacterized protein involved in chromosome segregation